MKSKITLLLLPVLLLLSCQGQVSNKEELLAMNKTVYEQALKYSDLNAATQAVLNIIALAPENPAYADSLAYLYFTAKAYVQTLFVCEDILQRNPNNFPILELAAVTNRTLGFLPEALKIYRDLYESTGKGQHLYEVSALCYKLKMQDETKEALSALIGADAFAQDSMTVDYGQGRQQRIPVFAAAWNLKGIMELDEGKSADARQSFQQALEIYPDFLLARDNLAKLGDGK